MEIDNLCQFNSKHFFQLFGLYVQSVRESFQITHQQLAANSCNFTDLDLKKIEAGEYILQNEELRILIDQLLLDETEILNLAKITQVQSIIELNREINEHFPR